MNTRELLEYAARACGVDGKFLETPKSNEEQYQCGISKYWGYRWWNPAADDGDCARMEAELGISVDWAPTNVMCGAWDGVESESAVERYEAHNGDKQSARRMASLRVAAEIGKAMK